MLPPIEARRPITPEPSRPSTPSKGQPHQQSQSQSQQENPFDFPVPNFRPNLANFGRKITQIRDDFMAEFEDMNAPDASPSKPPPRIKKPEDVPGMGDDPIMCPFCDKPLPPSVFTAHKVAHQPRTIAKSPAIRRTATTGGIQRSQLSGISDNHAKPKSSLTASSVTMPSSPTGGGAQTQAQSEAPTPSKGGKDAAVNPAELKHRISNAAATAPGPGISDNDLKRWYTLAGLEPPPSAKSSRSSSLQEKIIPKLAPPPPPAQSARQRSSVNLNDPDESDESADEGGNAKGYAKLTGAGSDTDEEVLRDEPLEIVTGVNGDVPNPFDVGKVEPPAPPPVPPASDLQDLLRDVLQKITEMVRSTIYMPTSKRLTAVENAERIANLSILPPHFAEDR